MTTETLNGQTVPGRFIVETRNSAYLFETYSKKFWKLEDVVNAPPKPTNEQTYITLVHVKKGDPLFLWLKTEKGCKSFITSPLDKILEVYAYGV